MILQAINTYKETMSYRIADTENLENKISFSFNMLNDILKYYTENETNNYVIVKELPKNANYDAEEREIHFDVKKRIISYKISHTNKPMSQGVASQGEFKLSKDEWERLVQYASIADFAQDDLNEINKLMFSSNTKPKLKISKK